MMLANPWRWSVSLAAGLLALGCAAEPAGERVLSDSEVRDAQSALEGALDELAATQGMTLESSERDEALRSIGEVLASLRESDVGSTTAALESEDLEAVPGEEIGDATGSGTSTSGSFGVSGASEGSFGDSSGASTTGSFGTRSGTGGSFDGPEGSRSSSFGTFTIPCRNVGSVVAFDMSAENFANELLRGLDCVTAGSNPSIRWGALPAGGPYTLFTLAFDLQTLESFASGTSTPSSFLLRRAWGPLTTSGRSITYGGPALSASGGLGFLIGIVASGDLDAPEAAGLLFAIIR